VEGTILKTALHGANLTSRTSYSTSRHVIP